MRRLIFSLPLLIGAALLFGLGLFAPPSAVHAAPLDAPVAQTTLTNTVTLSVPGGISDPVNSNNTAVDVDTLTRQADLQIRKTAASVGIPGLPFTYTIVVTNTGPSFASGARVSDTLPVSLLSPTWTCTAKPGSTCTTASGAGNISHTVNLAVNGVATFTISGVLDPAFTGALVNTANITTPVGTTETDPTDNTTPPVTTTATAQADVRFAKFAAGTAVPGQTLTYTLVVSNFGPSNAPVITVTDNLVAALQSATWTCVASSGSSCASASGAGSVNTTVNLDAGDTATITIIATVNSNVTGSITNTASITAPVDTNNGDNGDTTSTVLTPIFDLSATKTSNGQTTPGLPIVYTVTVTNAGPSAVYNAIVTDTVASGITGVTWSCAACNTTSGAGNAVSTTVTLSASASAVIVINGTIDPAVTGTLANVARITPPGTGTDPDPTDNTSNVISTTLTPQANLGVSKSNNTSAVIPGTTITYTIVVSNAGPSAAPDVGIFDTMPSAILSATWTCAATPGSSCAAASGTNDISTTVDLAANGRVTFTVIARVDATSGRTFNVSHFVMGMAPRRALYVDGAPARFVGVWQTPITNTVSLATPVGSTDPTLADNTASDADPLTPQADVRVRLSAAPTPLDAVSPVIYAVIITNSGPSAAVNALLTSTLSYAGNIQTLGAGASFRALAEASATSATCTQTASEILCALGTLAPGASVAYTFAVQPAQGGNLLVNTAHVGSNIFDPNLANNVDIAETPRRVQPAQPTATPFPTATPAPTATPLPTNTPAPTSAPNDPIVFKATSAEVVPPGTLVTFTLTAQNPSASALGAFTLRDRLPGLLTFITATALSGSPVISYEATSREVTALYTDLAAGTSVQVRVVAQMRADAPVPGEAFNVARAVFLTGREVTSNVVRLRTIPTAFPVTGQ